MPVATVNGVRINYDEAGAGEPVLLVMGSGSRGRVWHLHQVPALVAAGFRAVTFDNRGIPPSDECGEGFTVDDMVADTAALIEHLGVAPCRVVGVSLGARITQELALARPELVERMVLIATRGRLDTVRDALWRAELELHDAGNPAPTSYQAVVQAMQNLSPRTLCDDARMRDWLDVFELSDLSGPGHRAQLGLEAMANRLPKYRRITTPCHVVAFSDDLICPPALGAEVAEAIPGASFEVISHCGHYGYLEDPATVNKCVIEFCRT
jgi:pimeloyl-ACP methyl ester carboxylesterase